MNSDFAVMAFGTFVCVGGCNLVPGCGQGKFGKAFEIKTSSRGETLGVKNKNIPLSIARS
jgi:F0F1-type ATP synthase membrane subunit c/vacuolar-type H+-ATPase subunit K